MENLPINIVYIGSSAIGLCKLFENSCFSIVGILCLESRMNKDLNAQAAGYGYIIKSFKWIREFREIINSYPQQTPFFIYQLDMLVPPDLTDKYSFYNIHRGSLLTNRGPNPDIWPILNGEVHTSLSLHKINDKIDSGVWIDSFEVEIHKDDDTVSLKTKLEKGLPQLIESLIDYLNLKREGIILKGGIYKPWITEADFTIDIENDSFEIIDRKIRSQRQYNGAILIIENQKYYVLDILKCEEIVNPSTWVKILNDDRLMVCSVKKVFTFRLNHTPKFGSPPIRPLSLRI